MSSIVGYVDAATAGFLGAIAAIAVAGGCWIAWKKVSETLRTINRSLISSSQVIESLNRNADSFSSIEKLLAGMIRLSEAQVEATLKLEATIASLIRGVPATTQSAGGGGFVQPDPDDASREFHLQQLERGGMTREEAVSVLDGSMPDGSDGLYAALQRGLRD
jgi:hypothetical protein